MDTADNRRVDHRYHLTSDYFWCPRWKPTRPRSRGTPPAGRLCCRDRCRRGHVRCRGGLPGTLLAAAPLGSPALGRVSCLRARAEKLFCWLHASARGGWASPGQGQVGEHAPQRGCRHGKEHPEPMSAGMF